MARLRAGIDAELGIVAVARPSRSGAKAEVVLRAGGGGEPPALAGEARVPLRAAVLCLGGPQVFLRMLRLPGELDRRAVAEAVRWQVAEVVADRVLRHVVTGRAGDQWCVLVGGVPPAAARGLKCAALDLRAAALWRGAVHLLGGSPGGPVAVVEVSPSGGRVVAGREFLGFAREFGADSGAELQRTLVYCRSEFGDDLRVLRVGEDLPEETVALGLALHAHLEPRFNFLVRERLNLAGLAADRRPLRALAAALVLASLPHLAAFGYGAQAAEYARRAAALEPQVKKCAALRAEREKYEDWAAIVKAFSVSPAWPLMDDLRKAVPASCWLTAARTAGPQKQQQQGGQQPAQQQQQQKPQAQQKLQPAQQQQQPSLPERAASLEVEGCSLDVASVGLFKDNLEALPWCGGVTSVSVKWDDKAGAFAFKLTAAVRQPQEARAPGAKGR